MVESKLGMKGKCRWVHSLPSNGSLIRQCRRKCFVASVCRAQGFPGKASNMGSRELSHQLLIKDRKHPFTLVPRSRIWLPSSIVFGIFNRGSANDPLVMPHRAGPVGVGRLGKKPQGLHLLGMRNMLTSLQEAGGKAREKHLTKLLLPGNIIIWPESSNPLATPQ